MFSSLKLLPNFFLKDDKNERSINNVQSFQNRHCSAFLCNRCVSQKPPQGHAKRPTARKVEKFIVVVDCNGYLADQEQMLAKVGNRKRWKQPIVRVCVCACKRPTMHQWRQILHRVLLYSSTTPSMSTGASSRSAISLPWASTTIRRPRLLSGTPSRAAPKSSTYPPQLASGVGDGEDARITSI